MIDTFETIKQNEYTAELTEKKSKFIATLIKINSEEEIPKKIAEVQKKYRDAKHYVFAYRLSSGKERFSDDGEPSGTAGVPILELLRGEKLQNVLVVVTRYFGGILLGTGGLVKAYSTAAKEAIACAERVCMKLCNEYQVEVDYNYHNILLHYFKEQSIVVRDTIFSDKIALKIIIEMGKSEKIFLEISKKTDRTASIILTQTYYHE